MHAFSSASSVSERHVFGGGVIDPVSVYCVCVCVCVCVMCVCVCVCVCRYILLDAYACISIHMLRHARTATDCMSFVAPLRVSRRRRVR